MTGPCPLRICRADTVHSTVRALRSAPERRGRIPFWRLEIGGCKWTLVCLHLPFYRGEWRVRSGPPEKDPYTPYGRATTAESADQEPSGCWFSSMLIRQKTAKPLASVGQTDRHTHGPNNGWFLLDRLMSPNIRPVCTRIGATTNNAMAKRA